MSQRKCPICNYHQESNLYARSNYSEQNFNAFTFSSRKNPDFMHHRLYLCPKCDLVYASPIPDLSTLNFLYEKADFNSQSEAMFASKSYARYLSKIIQNLPDMDGALDVGTGEGSFLEELLKIGFTNVIGVEPSEKPILAAKKHIQKIIKKEIFIQKNYKRNSYSLISCFQTIEHVSDPLGMCKGFYSLLKENGAVFIVGHNYRALINKLLKFNSPIYDIEHLQLFSSASLVKLLETAGFKDIHTYRMYNSYPLRYYLQLLPIALKIKEQLQRLLELCRLSEFLLTVPIGNTAIIGYKNF